MLKAGVFLRPGVFFVFLLAAFGGLRADTGAAGTILRQAWEEYEYGEFAKASGLFSQALNGPGVSEKDQCQALVGLAFCSQFGKKSQVSASDYEEALRLYDRALPLALKTNDSKCAALVKSMSAECNFRLWQLDDDKKRLESANSLWDTVQKEYPCSIIAQDALLCETVLKTDSYLDDSSVENAKKLESYMKRHSNPVVMGKKDLKSMSPEEREKAWLCAPMSYCAADIYFYRGDNKKALQWFDSYCLFGPTSYASKNTAYYKRGKLAEKIGDTEAAIKYYTKYLEEIQSSGMRYYIEEKLKKLKSGVAEDGKQL